MVEFVGIRAQLLQRAVVQDGDVCCAGPAEEERNDDVLHGLRIALDKTRNYRNVNTVFERFNSRTSLLSVITEQRPLLLDPANPRNNLLSPDVHEFFDQMASFANVTLQRLEISEQCGETIPDLFAPQPNV